MGRRDESSRSHRRSRSRSRSPRGKGHKSKDDKSSKRESARGSKKRKKEDDTSQVSPRRTSAERTSPPLTPPPVDGGEQGEISLSIEETNKLREKLGLAPLETDKDTKVIETENPNEKIIVEDGNEFTHKIPDNWGEKKQQEKVREKLQAQKEKRIIKEKMLDIKGIADEDEEMTASDWVDRNRKITNEKEMADKRAKMLEEMDAEFGVGEIVERELGKRPNKKKPGYAQENLRGLTVQHSKQAFVEGQETILVLKDKDVLDADDGETLINPSLVESEMWKNNAQVRKKKTGYNPYEDADELDEFGEEKAKSMLGKYDEEIIGKEKDSFKLEGKDIDASAETRLAEIKARLKAAGQQSLETDSYKLATEYYTEQEMQQFKKPKKMKKKKVLRKKGQRSKELTADELVPIADVGNNDLGSRSKRSKNDAKFTSLDDKSAKSDVKTETTHVKKEKEIVSGLADLGDSSSEDELHNSLEQIHSFVVEDDAQDELQSMLDKTRKIKSKVPGENVLGAEKVSLLVTDIKEEETEEMEIEETGNDMILDATSEYCRGLGDLPTINMDYSNDTMDLDKEEDKEKKKRKKKHRSRHEDLPGDEFEQMQKYHKESKGKWVNADEPQSSKKKRHVTASSESESENEDAEGPALGNEISAGGGVGSALKLFKEKGYIDERDDLPTATQVVNLKHLEAQKFSVIDKQMHDIEDKYSKKLERMGGGGGPVRAFEEKKAYAPAFRITYCDEHGRAMTTKEAFRYQSWKFHGKGPGKKKIEHHERKFVERANLNSMNSSDTPLGTLGKQLEKQKNTQQAYIVLSGQGSRDTGQLKKE